MSKKTGITQYATAAAAATSTANVLQRINNLIMLLYMLGITQMKIVIDLAENTAIILWFILSCVI